MNESEFQHFATQQRHVARLDSIISMLPDTENKVLFFGQKNHGRRHALGDLT